MTRRAALIAAAAAPLAACTSGTSESGAAPADPDRIVRERATGAERGLIARYRVTAEAHPGLEPELAPFIARHERHLDEMLAAAPPSETDIPGSGPEERDIAPGDIPGSRAEAITALREAEQAHAAARTEDSMTSHDYDLAQLFASVAACESAHDHLLGEIA